MVPTTSNRTPPAHALIHQVNPSASGTRARARPAARTICSADAHGRRKRVKMHDANVARFLDIEAEVSEGESGSSAGASDWSSDSDGSGRTLCY